jgi:GntR family transcriptional regulator
MVAIPAMPSPRHLSLVESPPVAGHARYARIANALREALLAGRWQPGDTVPAESQLADEYRVALGTMRQAIAMLVEEGLLTRQQGRGTFVSLGIADASMLRFFRFGDAREPSSLDTPASKIIKRKTVPATAALATALGIRVGADVISLVRLRILDDTPCLVERIWLDAKRMRKMATSDPATWGDLLYPAYLSLCDVLVHRAEDTISFGALSAADAQHLKLAPGHACAIVNRRALDMAGQCVELRTTRGDAALFQYTVTLK